MSRGSSTKSKSLLCSSCKLGLRKCSLLSIHLLALVFEVLIGRVDFHLQAAFLDSTAQHVLLVIECLVLHIAIVLHYLGLNSQNEGGGVRVMRGIKSKWPQSNESALSNEDFKLMDIYISQEECI
eukprot:scaffold13792_cov57-Skeletonema_menzelii.AAC.1